MDGLVSLPLSLCVFPSCSYTTDECHEEREVKKKDREEEINHILVYVCKDCTGKGLMFVSGYQ